jgi:hypothetical protein
MLFAGMVIGAGAGFFAMYRKLTERERREREKRSE